MNRSKVEYCDFQWNPITGCKKNCEYCITRKKSKRFAGDVRHNLKRKKHRRIGEMIVLDEKFISPNGGTLNNPYGFEPTFHRYRLDNIAQLKSTINILVCGEGEMFGPWVPDEIIVEIFEACAAFPQHHYLFLTQFPQRYEALAALGILPKGDNYWYGYTMTWNQHTHPDIPGYHTFTVLEPMENPVIPIPARTEWVIIGAETGNRKERTEPLFDWVKNVVVTFDYMPVPVFMMDSLLGIVPEKSMRKDIPKILQERQLGPGLEKKLMDSCIKCGKSMRKNQMITLLARSGRGEQPKQFGFICRDCFREQCNAYGLEIPDLRNLRADDEEQRIQEQ